MLSVDVVDVVLRLRDDSSPGLPDHLAALSENKSLGGTFLDADRFLPVRKALPAQLAFLNARHGI